MATYLYFCLLGDMIIDLFPWVWVVSPIQKEPICLMFEIFTTVWWQVFQYKYCTEKLRMVPLVCNSNHRADRSTFIFEILSYELQEGYWFILPFWKHLEVNADYVECTFILIDLRFYHFLCLLMYVWKCEWVSCSLF